MSSNSCSSSEASISLDLSSKSAAISTMNSVAVSRSSSPRDLQVVEVGEHHVRERQLEQVDLFAQDQRQQQVERPAEHVQVEVERGDGHALHRTDQLDGRSAARADAHALAHLHKRAARDRPRARGPIGEDRIQCRLIRAQRGVALAHRREVLEHGLATAAFRSPYPRASAICASTASGVVSRATARISIRFDTPGLSGPRAISLPESVTALLIFRLDLARLVQHIHGPQLARRPSWTSCGSGPASP